ncbi:hypothetical protein TNCV_972341 [Trichonephila clavipes]|nr:hypothetical protein TNCV_972341 [Trichonephila clavipes]
MVLKANDRRTSCPCHDEFRGPRSDYVRQIVSLIVRYDSEIFPPLVLCLEKDSANKKAEFRQSSKLRLEFEYGNPEMKSKLFIFRRC